MSWKFLAWLAMSKYTGEVVTGSAVWDDYFFQSALCHQSEEDFYKAADKKLS